MKPFIIGIAGESGVGKSTLAQIISLFYKKDETLLLSTDDLHKYVRNDPAWQYTTHPDPEANNLQMGDVHLLRLRNNGYIYRSFYDHQTGCFLAPVELAPKPIIIIEGLHAFYTGLSQQYTDLKFYVDTDEQLAIHWKLIRDTTQRGYSREQAMQIISRRRPDNEKIRAEQKPAADYVISIKPKQPVKYLGDAAEEIELDVKIIYQVAVKPEYKPLIDFIMQYLLKMADFLHACKTIGNDIELCQGAGGNVSAKADGTMIIKASGVPLKDVNFMAGYSVIDHTKIPYDIGSDDELNFYLTDSAKINDRYPRPSMEAGLHAALREQYVLHAHPVYLTLLLCLQDSEQIIRENLINPEKHCSYYIPYANPGHELYKLISIAQESTYPAAPVKTFFLQNHGIVLAGDNMQQLIIRLKILNKWAWEYMKEKLKLEDKYIFSAKVADIKSPSFNGHLFPDDAVMPSASTRAMHNYIEIFGSMLGQLRYLSDENVQHLRNMEAEKYRTSQPLNQ